MHPCIMHQCSPVCREHMQHGDHEVRNAQRTSLRENDTSMLLNRRVLHTFFSSYTACDLRWRLKYPCGFGRWSSWWLKSFDTVRGDRSRGQPALNPTAQNCTLSCVRFFFLYVMCACGYERGECWWRLLTFVRYVLRRDDNFRLPRVPWYNTKCRVQCYEIFVIVTLIGFHSIH